MDDRAEKIFLQQDHARSYVAEIDDRIERVLVQAALSRAIGFLLFDEVYQVEAQEHPLNLLTFARAVHALFKNRPLLDQLLSGKYESLSDVPDVF